MPEINLLNMGRKPRRYYYEKALMEDYPNVLCPICQLYRKKLILNMMCRKCWIKAGFKLCPKCNKLKNLSDEFYSKCKICRECTVKNDTKEYIRRSS